MRKNLKKLNGNRMRFTAIVDRFGEKSAYRGLPKPTVMLKAVCVLSSGKQVTDHLWFDKGKSWEACKIGDHVEFDARVSEYEKGYKGHRDDVFDAPISIDYRLSRPTKLIIRQ